MNNNNKLSLRATSKNYAACMKFQAEIPAALQKQGKRKLGQIECINENLAVLHYLGKQYPLTVTRDFTRKKQHHLYKKHSRDGILEKVGHVYHRIEVSNELISADYIQKARMESRQVKGPKYFVNTTGERKRKREVVNQPQKAKPKITKPNISQNPKEQVKQKPNPKPKPTGPKTHSGRSRKEKEPERVLVPDDLKELVILLLAHTPQSSGNLRHTLERRGKKVDSVQFRHCLEEIADTNSLTKHCDLKPGIFQSITRQRIQNCGLLKIQEIRSLLNKITERDEEELQKVTAKDSKTDLPPKKKKKKTNSEIPDANVLRKQESMFEDRRQKYEGYQRQITSLKKKYTKLGEEWKNAKTTAAKGAKRTEIYASYQNDHSKLANLQRESEKLLKEMQEIKLRINTFYSKLNV